jgi:hypothetical protein
VTVPLVVVLVEFAEYGTRESASMHRTEPQEILLNQFGLIPGAGLRHARGHFFSGDDELGRWSSER